MAKIPTLKKILQENFPDLPWMNRLATPINVFIEEVTRAFNKRLTFKDNFDGEVTEFLDNGEYPIKLSWGRNSKPVGVWVVRIRRVDGAAASLSNAVTMDWFYNSNGEIEIENMVGLSASGTNKYYINIIAIVG